MPARIAMKVKKVDFVTFEAVGVLLLHIGELAVRFPCNHTDRLFFAYADCLCALAVFEFLYSILKRELCPLFWLIFACSFLIPGMERHLCILMPYEDWIARGMPSWGSIPQ